jgi:hypothetical protein
MCSAQTIITGTLVGFDGKPMIKSGVSLKQPMNDSVFKFVEAGKDGKFNIQIDSAGIWILHFVGVNHTAYQMALYVDKPVTENVDVRLKTVEYQNDFSKAEVVGNFNDWLILSAFPMKKDSDGKYSA